jgi:hypothetical protein
MGRLDSESAKRRSRNSGHVLKKTPATRGTRRGRLGESGLFKLKHCAAYNLDVVSEEGEQAGGVEDDERFHRQLLLLFRYQRDRGSVGSRGRCGWSPSWECPRSLPGRISLSSLRQLLSCQPGRCLVGANYCPDHFATCPHRAGLNNWQSL